MKYLWDIHCHILPGVDDGAKTIKESIALLREEASQGVTDIILTPHYRVGMFEPPAELVRQQYVALRAALMDTGEEWASAVTLYTGCEYHADAEMSERLRSGERPALAGSSCVLTEFRESDYFDYIRNVCIELQSSGFIPVIAHAERIRALRKADCRALTQLTQGGILIQINADSVLGLAGLSCKLWCRSAIRKGLVHFVASDAHNLRDRKPNMKKCAEYLTRAYGYPTAARLMRENAQHYFRK